MYIYKHAYIYYTLLCVFAYICFIRTRVFPAAPPGIHAIFLCIFYTPGLRCLCFIYTNSIYTYTIHIYIDVYRISVYTRIYLTIAAGFCKKKNSPSSDFFCHPHTFDIEQSFVMQNLSLVSYIFMCAHMCASRILFPSRI